MKFTLVQIILALHLVQLTGLDGQKILLNPEQVIDLKEPRGQPGEHFTAAVKCLIFTSNGKYTAVIETCAEVRYKLEEQE
jgi:uncharacterized protein YlzI (FlbEa/FlbD family)